MESIIESCKEQFNREAGHSLLLGAACVIISLQIGTTKTEIIALSVAISMFAIGLAYALAWVSKIEQHLYIRGIDEVKKHNKNNNIKVQVPRNANGDVICALQEVIDLRK